MQNRKSLKHLLLRWVSLFMIIMIVIITLISIKLQADNTIRLTEIVLERESISYANEIHSWWSNIEERVGQTAAVLKNLPENSYEETLAMLLEITKQDPDSQDIYIAYGNTGKFLDGSGWVPDDTFVFTDRAWYTGALEMKGDIYSSDPYVDASTGKTCLACSIMLGENTVLSSDINFDLVAAKVDGFESSADNASYYIVDKKSKDVLISSDKKVVGTSVTGSLDPVLAGLSEVIDTLDTSASTAGTKPANANTSAGTMVYTATDIADTSWIVVSAVPYSFIIGGIISNMVITLAFAALLIAVFAVILYVIISKFINPVSTVTERIIDISGGDFTVELKPEGNNEITTLSERMNEYIGHMRATLKNLADVSSDMNTSAGECFDISKNLSDANHAQGRSIERLNVILGDMNRSIDEVANAATELAQTSGTLTDHADNIRKLCNETLESSSEGKHEMDGMTANVSTLNSTIGELTQLIKDTAKSIEKITGITDTINAISEQTNLLSLNASIEAARAGEAGRGFAVVASEVGALALQSTDATESIRSLIGSITKNIEDIDSKADICARDMEACMTGVEKANRSFATIYGDVAKATEGIIEIAGGIEKINDVASNNAAATEEQASTISEILSLSDQIVSESNKLLSETENIASISGKLNRYSDTVNSDLTQYTL